ncbi:AbrB/MazE/SpoVT family DNA-binding domain-containing protein [Metabacillus niabensis]|uniref:AbrB/MazE/SpoVT family DNA-binding domain-containing protein n=1 Tax=Metabacillus niabensis TaxID=324854 RepID=UPI0039A1D73F
MKSIGIVRKVDELGRIVIPKEIRRVYEIKESDPLEIFVDGEMIVLKPYKPNKECMITGNVSDDNISIANGKVVLSKEGAEQLIQELKEVLEK